MGFNIFYILFYLFLIFFFKNNFLKFIIKINYKIKMDSDDEIYINEAIMSGEKPKISEEKRNELLQIGKDSICKISLPDMNYGNGYFCQINYNGNKYNVLIITITNEEDLQKIETIKIRYKGKIILIEKIILNINSRKYNFIEINNKEINDFYEIKVNFNGDFNEEIENKIKKEGNKFICEILFPFIGTGFICKIPYNNNNINVLFTNNHIINKDLLLKGKIIRFIYKGDPKEIEITENRLIWTDSTDYKKGLDYTCIQIFDEDGFNTKNIFQIEDFNLSNYNDLEICILQYPKDKIELTTGYIKKSNKKKFFHNVDTEFGSSGSPIICINNNKVIGIHRGYNKEKLFNFGSLIKYVLEHINYSILCEYNIKDEDLNKDIQILNCYEEVKIKNNSLEGNNNKNEIRNNCELYLNDKKINFTFKYSFSNKGINKINIKCKKDLIIDMNYMFFNCSSLISLNLSNFNINNVINMSYMFYNCSSLISLNLSNFNTNKVNNMEGMFSFCSSLTSLNLSNFNTNNVSNMEGMFSFCSSLTSLNLSNFNTNNVINMSYMFSECFSLDTLNLSSFNTNNVKDMKNMFCNCSSFESLNLSNFNTNNVEDMKNMFCNCSSLISLNLSNFNTNNVTNMKNMFYNCSSLKSLNLSNFNTNNVINMKNMFYNCSSLKSLNLSNFNNNNVTNMNYMFYNCSKLTSLNLSKFNNNNITNNNHMFYNCSSLTSLNLSNFNINNIWNMSYMFDGINKKKCKIETKNTKFLYLIK